MALIKALDIDRHTGRYSLSPVLDLPAAAAESIVYSLLPCLLGLHDSRVDHAMVVPACDVFSICRQNLRKCVNIQHDHRRQLCYVCNNMDEVVLAGYQGSDMLSGIDAEMLDV